MLYILKLVAIIGITVPAALLTILFGLFDSQGKRVYNISRWWSWGVLKAAGISVKVNGLSHVDPNRRYLFMANHQSNIDIPVLIQALRPFQLRWIAKRELLWVPLFGWAMWAAKHVTVNRADRSDALASLKKAKKRIAGGISLVVFPEGTRSPDGRLLPFKRGGFWLAAKTGTPVVPVTVDGSGALLRKGDWRIRRGIIQVTVGAPLEAENHRSGALLALSQRIRENIAGQLRSEHPLARPPAGPDAFTSAGNESMSDQIH